MNPCMAGGHALIVVLWLITLLTMMTMSYHVAARTEAKLLAQSVYRAQAAALAEAGMWLAVREHFQSGSVLTKRAMRVERVIELRDAMIDVSLADVSGRINLNVARSELIDAALAQAIVVPIERERLLHAILDWRDGDHEKQPNGAEDDEYARLGYSYGAKDASFATVDELRYVAGMTDDVFHRVAPLLTVHGDHTRVNIEAAPVEVLRALPGADDGVVAGLVRRRGDAALRDVITADGLDRRFTQSGGTGVYCVTATAAAGGSAARVIATVRYAHGEKEPIQVLTWESR